MSKFGSILKKVEQASVQCVHYLQCVQHLDDVVPLDLFHHHRMGGQESPATLLWCALQNTAVVCNAEHCCDVQIAHCTVHHESCTVNYSLHCTALPCTAVT